MIAARRLKSGVNDAIIPQLLTERLHSQTPATARLAAMLLSIVLLP